MTAQSVCCAAAERYEKRRGSVRSLAFAHYSR